MTTRATEQLQAVAIGLESSMPGMEHLLHLTSVAEADVEHLLEKERTYRGSWKKRGGIGAFMMLARKWDRLENMMAQPMLASQDAAVLPPYDVLARITRGPGGGTAGPDGTVLAEVRDLRRYLLLVEAEVIAMMETPMERRSDPLAGVTIVCGDCGARGAEPHRETCPTRTDEWRGQPMTAHHVVAPPALPALNKDVMHLGSVYRVVRHALHHGEQGFIVVRSEHYSDHVNGQTVQAWWLPAGSAQASPLRAGLYTAGPEVQPVLLPVGPAERSGLS